MGLKNYLLKDPVLDWYKLYYYLNNSNPPLTKIKSYKKITRESTQNNIFFEMGNKFESDVMKELYKRFPNDIVRAVNDRVIDLSYEGITLKLMSRGG